MIEELEHVLTNPNPNSNCNIFGYFYPNAIFRKHINRWTTFNQSIDRLIEDTLFIIGPSASHTGSFYRNNTMSVISRIGFERLCGLAHFTGMLF